MSKLVLYRPDGSTRAIALDKERITIGRRPDNDIALPFAAVSGEHAAVVTVLADSFLEDLGSTNGTLVNGKSIRKHFLRDRDRIAIGREQLVYYADDDAHPEPLAPDAAQEPRAGLERRKGGGDDASTGKEEAGFVALDARVEPMGRAGPFRSVVSDPDATAAPAADGASAARAVDTHRAAEPEFALRVVTGPSAGRELPLTEYDFFLGRVGVAVAVIRHVDRELRLIPVEGPELPRHNGEPVGPDGVVLSDDDTILIAGSELAIARR